MSRNTVYKRCSLCFTKDEPDGGNLINYDSLQLCEKCYNKFRASAYNQRVGLLNSIKCYRRLIAKYEDSGNIQLDTSFDNVFGGCKSARDMETNK